VFGHSQMTTKHVEVRQHIGLVRTSETTNYQTK
jgi:hypothetical protein